MNNSSIKKDYIWNTVGSAVYALSSMVLAFIAMHFLGPDDGGIFGFGFSTLGQQMFIVAYFGIRPYHITDTRYEYSYNDYRKLRQITASAAALTGAAYLILMLISGQYDIRKCIIMFMLILYKICDGIADLYESECQRIDKLYIGGMELALRTLLASLALAGLIIIRGNLILSASAAVIMQLVVILYFRHYLTEKLLKPGEIKKSAETGTKTGTEADADAERIKGLAKNTLLIFLSVFVDFYIFSAAKYAVDFNMTDADNGIFNILFMPTSVIYLAANFIIRPYMSRLSRVWDEKAYDNFKKAKRILFYYILLMSAAGIILTYFLGRPMLGILELILGSEYTGLLTERHYEFLLIITGGCFYAMTNLFYYLLIIMRKQSLIFMNYIIMAVGAFVLSKRAVTGYGLTGAAAAYAAYMLLLTIVFASTVQKNLSNVTCNGEY